MRSVLSLALKDLRLLSRDWMALFFIIAFPVIMGVFFGLIGMGFSSGSPSSAIPVGIVDLDESDISRRFVENLSSNGAIEVRPAGREEARRLVLKGNLVAYVEIPAEWGATAGLFWMESLPLKLGTDPSRGAEAGMVGGYIMQAMGELLQDRFADTAGMREQVRRSAENAQSDETMAPAERAIVGAFMGTLDMFLGSLEQFTQEMDSQAADSQPSDRGPRMELAKIERVDVTVPANSHDKLVAKLCSPWDISFPAAIMWGVMGTVAGFAISLVRERTGGTLLRLQVAPITRTHVLGGKALACFLSVAGVIAFMMILGKILGIQLARPGLLLPAVFCIAVCFVGLMMLMAVLGKTEAAVGGAGWAIIVVMCMFGGGMMPLAFMPRFMQTMSHFSPVKWGILALEGAVWRGFTVIEMLEPCGILLGIGVVAFATGAIVFSRQDG